jgi:hypothetical protein
MEIVEGEIIIALKYYDNKKKMNLKVAHLYRVNSAIQDLLKGKGKAIPLQAWTGPDGTRRLWLSDFTHEDGKFVSPGPGHLYPQEIFLVLISVRG